MPYRALNKLFRMECIELSGSRTPLRNDDSVVDDDDRGGVDGISVGLGHRQPIRRPPSVLGLGSLRPVLARILVVFGAPDLSMRFGYLRRDECEEKE